MLKFTRIKFNVSLNKIVQLHLKYRKYILAEKIFSRLIVEKPTKETLIQMIYAFAKKKDFAKCFYYFDKIEEFNYPYDERDFVRILSVLVHNKKFKDFGLYYEKMKKLGIQETEDTKYFLGYYYLSLNRMDDFLNLVKTSQNPYLFSLATGYYLKKNDIQSVQMLLTISMNNNVSTDKIYPLLIKHYAFKGSKHNLYNLKTFMKEKNIEFDEESIYYYYYCGCLNNKEYSEAINIIEKFKSKLQKYHKSIIKKMLEANKRKSISLITILKDQIDNIDEIYMIFFNHFIETKSKDCLIFYEKVKHLPATWGEMLRYFMDTNNRYGLEKFMNENDGKFDMDTLQKIIRFYLKKRKIKKAREYIYQYYQEYNEMGRTTYYYLLDYFFITKDIERFKELLEVISNKKIDIPVHLIEKIKQNEVFSSLLFKKINYHQN